MPAMIFSSVFVTPPVTISVWSAAGPKSSYGVTDGVAERLRLAQADSGEQPWRAWGPTSPAA